MINNGMGLALFVNKPVFTSPSRLRIPYSLAATLTTWQITGSDPSISTRSYTSECYFWLHICARDNAVMGYTAFKRVCITRLPTSLTVSLTDLHPIVRSVVSRHFLLFFILFYFFTQLSSARVSLPALLCKR